jgi:large subunit ribosomal protein L24
VKKETVNYKIKAGDTVKLTTGKDKNKQGKVLKVNKNGRIIVEGVNMVKKAMRKTKQNQQGGIMEIESSIHISNVRVICKKCGPTRIGYKIDNKNKIRICRKCGEQL